MRQIFMCVLSLSLSGALTGLLVLLIRPVTGRFLSKRWNYYIWLLVIARLMIPVYFDMGYSSVLTKGGAAGPEEKTAGVVSAAEQGEGISMQDKEQEEEIFVSGTGNQIKDFLPKEQPGADWGVILGTLWLAGAGISLFIKLKNYLCFTSGIRRSCEPVPDGRINDMAKELAQKLCMRKGPAIYKSGNVSVPITVGLVRPVVVLPEEEWDFRDLQMVLHHELLHVKRKDLWYKWVYQFLLCVHWFNPILYLISIKLNIDCELSCDEAVLRALTKTGQRAYGNVLIDTARKNMNLNRNVPSTTLLERKEDLKMRLKGILHYKKPGGLRAVLSICLAGIILLLSACGSVQAEPDAMPVQITAGAGGDEAEKESVQGPDGYSAFWDEVAARYVSFWDDVGISAGDWIDSGLDDFLEKPVLADKQGEAWRAYDDDSLTAGKDISGQWHMHNYSGGGQIKCDGMYLNGTASVRIFNAKGDVDLQIDSSFEVKEGRFKIVHVSPGGKVTVINDTGEAGSFTVNMEAGRNVIKFVGQGAKIRGLRAGYPYLREEDFESIYYSEQDEESAVMAAEIKEGKVDKEKLTELIYYLDEDVVSEALAVLLRQGVPLTDDELKQFIMYSNPDLSVSYLEDAIRDGKTDYPGDRVIADIAPYLDGDKLMGLLLAAGGEVSGDTVRECAPYLGSARLKEVLLDRDDISFGLIRDCAPYLGSGRLEEVLKKYLEMGNELTYSQFDDISPYLGGNAAKRLDELRPLKPLAPLKGIK